MLHAVFANKGAILCLEFIISIHFDLTKKSANMAQTPLRAAFRITPRLGTVLKGRRSLTSASAVQQDDFLEHFMRTHLPPRKSIEYFSSMGWTREVLADDAYEIVPFWSRHGNPDTGENRFFATTVNTDTTIPHLLSMKLKDLSTPDPATFQDKQDLLSPNGRPDTHPDVQCLVSLGQELEAHPSIVHGGFQCVLLDEITRFLVLVHENNVRSSGLRPTHVTVSMKTSYRAPVATPGDVLVRAWLVGRQGRKWLAAADIVDASGKILTDAESVWVTTKKET